MVRRLCDIILDAEDLLRLEPEELAGAILETLQDQNVPLHYRNYLGRLFPDYGPPTETYPTHYRAQIRRAICEAWGWLESEGFLAKDPTVSRGEFCFVTRRGQGYPTREKVAAYRKAKALPEALIHPSIRDKVWSTFRRGDHDTAVFQAFKEVEVAVRTACGYPPMDLGVALMRKAFAPENGPLTDTDAPKAEQQALSDLFAGAIGSYKNPQSHRHVGIPSAEEAAEMIILASHLLRIVEARAPATAAPQPAEAAP